MPFCASARFSAFLLFCFSAFRLPDFLPLSPPFPPFAAFAGASGFLSAPDGMARERYLPGCRSAFVCRFWGGFADTPGSARFGWDGAEREAPASLRCELRRRSARRPWWTFGASRGVRTFSGRVGPRHGEGTAGHEKNAVPTMGSSAFALRFADRGGQSRCSAADRGGAAFRQQSEVGEAALPAGLGLWSELRRGASQWLERTRRRDHRT